MSSLSVIFFTQEAMKPTETQGLELDLPVDRFYGASAAWSGRLQEGSSAMKLSQT